MDDMKQRMMKLIAFCMVGMMTLTGCVASLPQSDEDVWVLAEQITYDENGNVSNRAVYEYDGSERKYRVCHYNSKNEAYGTTEVVQTKDGTKRTETHYYGEGNASFVQMDYEYRKDGKPLSQKNIAGDASVTQERIWNWNADGTVAEVLEDGVYRYTIEYDDQGRENRSYNEEYETTYTYDAQGKVLRTSYTNKPNVEYVVQKYDAQGRTIETVNYALDVDRPYTDEDIAAKSECAYDEDGHSYVVTSAYNHETEQTLGQIHFIYKPLREMIQSADTK